MVEDDDEENFGHFNFVMNPNHTSNRTSSTTLDEDDWGDFVDHSAQITVGVDLSGGLSPAHPSPNSLGTSNPSVQSPKIQWAKPQGAIPLSIFGLEEDEEEELGSGVVDSGRGFGEISFAGRESGSARNSGVGVEINDLIIANLYSPNQQIKGGTGSPLKSNMEFDPLNFNNSLNLKSNGSDLNVNGVHSYSNRTNFDGDSLNFEVNGVKPNGFHSDLTNVAESIEDDGEEVDDFDGWEFKAAESVMPTGDDQKSKVDGKGQEGFNGVAQAFEFVINGHNHGGSTVQSNGAVNNIDKWDFGFSLDPSPVAQHGTLSNAQNKNGQNDPDNGFNLSPIDRNANTDEHVWDFKDAFSDASDYKLEESKPVTVPPNGVVALVLNGSVDISLFAADGISHKSSEQQNFNLNFKPNWGQEDRKLGNQDSNFHDTGKDLKTSPVNENDDFNENTWDFKSAVTDSGSNNEGEPGESVAGFEAPAFSFSSNQNLESWSNHQKALPLSIFGDEELETNDDFSINQDPSTCISVTHEGHYSKNPSSNVSINDLISSLYSQAEKNGSINYSPEENDNGINSSSRMSRSDLGNDDDDDSWEFKDASPDINVPDQIYVTVLGDLPKQSSTGLQFDCYMDFYYKLNLALNPVVHGLLENLKKAQSIASLSGEDAKSKAIYEEIQNFSAELSQENLIAENVSSEFLLPRDNSFNELFEMLRDPRFQMLDKEYHLSKRLLLAENDLRSAIELLKHVVSTLKILKLVSVEEQSNYVSIWYQMVFVCFHELKHGALIWKESVLRNVESYILSEPQGKQYICALSEIYRVVQVLWATVKLYKPWILLGYVDSSGLISLLNECSAFWSSSGLVGALCKIDDPTDCKAVLDSIDFIQNLDEWGLRKHVLSGQQPTCCLSLISAESIPGLELVVWNGENYFLKLANLWANLIRRDPPFIRYPSSR
ncbi:uncharacterized protein LOC111018805 isoform X2 [Momordica charantia]|uniref:Uncharacterized protein LOC111018805 isoform X2 n=1 Tax=Momordica charantia TaxID=3673 RepID=A0A6J1DBK5_MOMCH|nr:uncharacterized protein LOC111018805 isoform X2 [Momordica charantia]